MLKNFLDANDDNVINKKDVVSAFGKSDDNGSKDLDRKEFSYSTRWTLTKICMAAAKLDQECFKTGTDPRGKVLKDLVQVLDEDYSQTLSKREFTHFFQMMDLDNDVDVNRLEVASWINRNVYIICRPFRTEILKDLEKKALKYYHPLFLFLDADNSKIINKTDVSSLVTELDTNNDQKVS